MLKKLMAGKSIYVPKDEWLDPVKDCHIVDIVIFNSEKISIVLRENIPVDSEDVWDHEIPTYGFSIYLCDDKVKTGYQGFEGFDFPKIGVSRKPIGQLLMSNKNWAGQVFAGGSGESGMEEVNPGGKPSTGIVSIQRLVCIDGWAYALSLFRKVFKRTAVGEWTQLKEGMELNIKGDTLHAGFADMDGTDDNNLYAVGGRGDVWRYDGKRWHQCDFPANHELSTVTVAPDGQVYISGISGLWVGKKDTWQLVCKGSFMVSYNDSVWFNGQLWLSADYHLHIWDGEKLQRPLAKDGSRILHSGHMDAHDGILAVAGPSTVHAYDGDEWYTLIAPYGDSE